MKLIGRKKSSITCSDNIGGYFPDYLTGRHFELFGFDLYFQWPIVFRNGRLVTRPYLNIVPKEGRPAISIGGTMSDGVYAVVSVESGTTLTIA